MTPPVLANKRISIIGAGPGGLVCARILQRRGLSVTVYEREASEHSRGQGGSLDLHPDDGQRALDAAGLLDQFFARARFDGQAMRQLGIDGSVRMSHEPDPDDTSAPEIDRGHLRDLLLHSLDAGTVQWGRALESVEGVDAGPRTLVFADGSTVETDLVIGADGAWSRVRRAVSDAVPLYSGVSFLEAWFDDVTVAHPELAALVGAGSALATDGDRALFAQRNSGDHMRVYIVRRQPVDWLAMEGLVAEDAPGIRAHLLSEFSEWAPELRDLFAENDGDYVDRPLFVLPAPHVWAPSATVTLLGDAAHLMPPVGVGVNYAMLDGAELAIALSESDSIERALRTYEGTMIPRSSELAAALEGNADFLLGMDGPPEFAEGEDPFGADGPGGFPGGFPGAR